MIKLFKKDVDNEVLSLSTSLSLMELYNVFSTIANTLIVSFISEICLSGVSFAGQYVTIFVWAIFGLNKAVMVLATQYYGKNDESALKKILNTSTFFSIIVSLLFFIGARFFATQILSFLTNDPDRALVGARYLSMYSYAILINGLSKMYIALLKSTSKEKIATLASSFGVIINIIFDIILVFGFLGFPAMGVEGAAVASIIGTFVEFLFCLIISFGKDKIKYSIFKIIKPDGYFLKEIFKYALPTIMCYAGWAAADTITVSVIGHMNTNIIDAFSFIKIFANIPQSIFTGTAMAWGIVIGKELGKNNLKQAKEYGDYGLKRTKGLAIFTFVLTLALGFIATFIKGFEKEAFLAYVLVILAYTYRFTGGTFINYFNCGPLSAGGEAEFLMLVDMVNMWCVIVPGSLLLFYILKAPEAVVFFYIFSSEYTKMASVYSHYKKYVWVRDLTKNDWFLPLAGSFIDKYKRNFKLRIKIMLSEFLTKRFENSTDFIFSLNNEKLSEALENFQKYLEDYGITKDIAYKCSLAIEEIFVTSRENTLKIKNENYDFASDIGVRIKNEKIRFIYYDNGTNIKNILEDDQNVNIHVLKSIAEKFEYKRIFLGLNKILVRYNRV